MSPTEPACAAERMDALGRLAGGVAHELNNVLMVITGYTEMLAEAPDTSRDVRDGLRMIADAGQRATEITRQLLLFGRRQVADACEVNAARAVASAVPAIRRLVPASAIVHIDVDDMPLRVHIDPAHLERLLLGLAVFSRDAVPEGATVTLAAAAVTCAAFVDPWGVEAPAGDYVRITVAHSTVAEPGTRARLFEPFFTTKPVGKGAALTLAVAYGIVRANRGYLDVVTDAAGSRFEVLLPLLAASGQSDGEAALVGTSARPA